MIVQYQTHDPYAAIYFQTYQITEAREATISRLGIHTWQTPCITPPYVQADPACDIMAYPVLYTEHMVDPLAAEMRVLFVITYRLGVRVRDGRVFAQVLMPWYDRYFVDGDPDLWSTLEDTSE